MEKVISGAMVEDQDVDPLSDVMADYLLSLKKELPFLDYKKTISISKDANFVKIAKDIFAFSNYGGGFILSGVSENDRTNTNIKSKFILSGLPESYISIDDASLQEKFNAYANFPLEIRYREFERELNGEKRMFSLMYIPPAHKKIQPIKDATYVYDEKKRFAFRKDDIYIRRGTQSIIASKYEEQLIDERAKDQHYRLSVLSGTADNTEETLKSNIFEITSIPKYVWLGTPKSGDYKELGRILLTSNVTNRFFNFKIWNGSLVSLENISDQNNIYNKLLSNSAHFELVSEWLSNKDKRRIIIELMKRTVIKRLIDKGMRFDEKTTKKIFFIHSKEKQFVTWSKNMNPGKQMSSKLYASQLHKYIYTHAAIMIDILEIEDKFYFQINPSFVLTEDGINPVMGPKEGTVITKLSYKIHNNLFLDSILFWIELLSDDKKIELTDNFKISIKPIQVQVDKGIKWDIPVRVIKESMLDFENDLKEAEDDF